MVRITDKSFVYTPSYDTDLGKKFRTIIEQQRKAKLRRTVHSARPAFVPVTFSARTPGPA
jgi:hypothetical protein